MRKKDIKRDMCVRWPLNVCLVILRIPACVYAYITKQNTFNESTCSYIVFKINTLPCKNIVLLRTRNEYYANITKYISIMTNT